MLKQIAAAALLFAGSAASAALMGEAAAPTLVRGTVTSLSGQTLMLTGKGDKKYTLTLAPETRVAAASTIGIDAIKPNSFVGTAAEPGKDGTLRAVEVHVFAESMRGLGEGHRPWDLSKTSSMTNGNVTKVDNAKRGKGRTLLVDYHGGQQTVVVPATVPIVSFDPGTLAQVVPGAHVFAVARSAARRCRVLSTNQLVVGVNGTVPPM